MLQRERHDHVLTLRLAHGKASALDVELCRAVTAALREATTSHDTRAIVLTGSGSIFCAGVDLFRLIKEDAEYARQFLPALIEMIETLFTTPKPVVAAANGHAIAGGCILVAASDYRMMAANSGRIGVPELVVTVPFPALALEVVRFAYPPQHVQEIVYFGSTFTPEDALRRGMLDEVVEAGRLEARAMEIAQRLAAIPTEVFRLAKEGLRRDSLARAHANAAVLDREAEEAWASPITHERVRAYLERTIGKR